MMYQSVDEFFTRVVTEAELRGLAKSFIYMNYASHFQDVISCYGAGFKAKLQEVAAKYIPYGIYQTLQPSSFKLAGAPSQGRRRTLNPTKCV
ncbi:hypothetical protein BJX63DRAFT_400028 [Aspergillus granulosus]|uniref:Uncharacterized protein n=1 Tax=Aspergillus granulosus TaxID=176169 RepID=A0ABR4H8J6_9EURO